MEAQYEEPRGILNQRAGAEKFQLARYLPSADLRFFIERYWTVRWYLRGQAPYVQETLPYPSVNLAIERGRSGVYGVDTGKFSRRLEGAGRVFGVKFRAGAFYPFLRSSVAALTNRIVSIGAVFGDDGMALEETILALDDEGEMVAVAEAFLRARLPPPDERVRVIHHIVAYILAHPDITRVDDLARRLALNTRTLQRLFARYVGVSPKWVISRYRLHEAAERATEHASEGDTVDWTRMAAELGYFDQAHFIKAFKAIVGSTPARYAKRSG